MSACCGICKFANFFHKGPTNGLHKEAGVHTYVGRCTKSKLAITENTKCTLFVEVPEGESARVISSGCMQGGITKTGRLRG